MWSSHYCGKRLTLRVSFIYAKGLSVFIRWTEKGTEKGKNTGKSSITRSILDDRDAQLGAEENACGQ